MTSDRPYGKRAGLPDRLDAAADNLARNKSLPWLGLGLYEDLRAAAAALRGEPEPVKAGTRSAAEISQWIDEERLGAAADPGPRKPPMEFDL